MVSNQETPIRFKTNLIQMRPNGLADRLVHEEVHLYTTNSVQAILERVDVTAAILLWQDVMWLTIELCSIHGDWQSKAKQKLRPMPKHLCPSNNNKNAMYICTIIEQCTLVIYVRLTSVTDSGEINFVNCNQTI